MSRKSQNDPQLGLYSYTISHTNPTKQRAAARDATAVAIPLHALVPERANMSNSNKLYGKNATLSFAPTWEETTNTMMNAASAAAPRDATSRPLGAGKSAMLPPDFRKKTR